MKRLFILFLFVFLLVGMAACGGVNRVAPSPTPLSAPDSDVGPLLALGQQALQMARSDIPDAILRQVYTDLTITTFHFTDAAATRLVSINIPTPGAAPGEWKVDRGGISPLLGSAQPGLDLSVLHAGPGRMSQAISAQWPACQPRGLDLILQDGRLTWIGFCLISEGEVTAMMDAQTGVFQPSAAPPARLPGTATPNP